MRFLAGSGGSGYAWWEAEWSHQLGVASQVSDVLVKRYPLLSGTSLGGSQADCEDGVGTQLTLVVGAVQLDHGSVDCGLVRWI